MIVWRSLIARLLIQTGVQEVDEALNRKAVATDRSKLVSVTIQKSVVRLGVDTETCTGYVGIDTSNLFESLAFRCGQPFSLIKLSLVVHIESHKDIFISKNIKHSRVAPDTLLHLAAVDATMAGDVHKDGFVLSFGGSKAFLQGKVAVQTKGHLKAILPAVRCSGH